MNITERELRFQTVCLAILTITTIAFAIYFLRPILIPFVLAIVANFILTATIDAQQKYLKIPYPLAIIISLLLGLLSVFLLWILLSTSFHQMAANAIIYKSHIHTILDKFVTFLQLDRFGIDAQTIINPSLQRLSEDAGSFVLSAFNRVIGLFSKGFLVIIFLLFLLMGRKNAIKKESQGIWSEIESRIKCYLVTKFCTSAVTGVLIGFTLLIFGVDLALFFGVAAFVLNFIPSIGSIIAMMLPIPIILFMPEMTTLKMIFAIGIPIGIEFTIGNIIEPKIMGETLDLHPIVILMALIFWGMLWGVVGMLLAAPLTAIMKIIFERIEVTRPLAALLSGRIDILEKN